jgi:ABC-type antimicrobial peptide transport system permease subunit
MHTAIHALVKLTFVDLLSCCAGRCASARAGVLVAATLTLQFNLFTELPFRMEFPSVLFGTMLAMSFIVAIAGSAMPAHAFLNKSISAVLRRQ